MKIHSPHPTAGVMDPNTGKPTPVKSKFNDLHRVVAHHGVVDFRRVLGFFNPYSGGHMTLAKTKARDAKVSELIDQLSAQILRFEKVEKTLEEVRAKEARKLRNSNFVEFNVGCEFAFHEVFDHVGQNEGQTLKQLPSLQLISCPRRWKRLGRVPTKAKEKEMEEVKAIIQAPW
ncbi:hypothetical protein Droror1_Dr00027011 [Drosera rotundifolia]